MQKSINFDKIVEEFITQKEVSRATLVQLVDKITISQDKVITIYYKFNILNKLDNKGNIKPYEKITNRIKTA